jgi:hypothetical protein
MFDRRSSVLMLGLAACGEPGVPLERVTKAWAAETGIRAVDSITGTLVLAGLASELCILARVVPGEWADPEILPISDALHEALGAPWVHGVESASGGSVMVTLAGVSIAGRTGQWLRFSMLTGDTTVQFDFDPLVADDDVGDETVQLEGFGHTSVSVGKDCSPEIAVVTGQALWVDLDGRSHDIKIPADSGLGTDLIFGGGVPWLPDSGALSWEAKIDGQQRSMLTESGAEIRMDDAGDARWPVTIYGPDWIGTGLILIAP